MKRMLPLSLVLTTLNEERAVSAFFDGVFAGTVHPAEIVVCDGGSKDGTLRVCEEYASRFPCIKVISEPGANIAKGRNVAIAHASHSILAISDAGCMIEEHWLERIAAPLLENEAVHVVAGGYALTGETAFERCAAASNVPIHRHDPATFLPSSRSFAVRKEALLAAGGYPEHLTFAGEDTALCVRLKEMGYVFVNRWDAVVQWRQRPTLRSLCKQHYLYGLGDGESGMNSSRYPRIASKLGLMLSLIAGGFFFPWLFAAALALALLYYIRLFPLYEWKNAPLGVSIGGYLLVFVKEAFLLFGFAKGFLSRKRDQEK